MFADTDATWAALRRVMEAKLNDARALLESPGLDDRETQFQRGRVKAFKEMLAVNDPEPRIPDQSPLY